MCLFLAHSDLGLRIGLGLAIPITIILIVLFIVCIAKLQARSRIHSPHSTRATAVNNSRVPQHHYAMTVATQNGNHPSPATVPEAKSQGILYSAEPPSYASVIADDGRYTTLPIPPPYPGLSTKKTETPIAL